MRSIDNKRMQSIDLIEINAYGINKGLVCKKEEIKCDNVIQYKTEEKSKVCKRIRIFVFCLKFG